MFLVAKQYRLGHLTGKHSMFLVAETYCSATISKVLVHVGSDTTEVNEGRLAEVEVLRRTERDKLQVGCQSR